MGKGSPRNESKEELDIDKQIEQKELEESRIRQIDVDLEEFVVTDKMLKDLEKQLNKEDEPEWGKDMSIKDRLKKNLEIIKIIRKRIFLKEKAFQMFPKAIKGAFSPLCQFFLLKAQIYELSFFESIMFSDENKLGLPLWEKFREKSGFAKFLSSILSKEEQLLDILDKHLAQARIKANLLSQKQNMSTLKSYLNDDPLQNPEPVLKVLLPSIIQKFLHLSEPALQSNSKTTVLRAKLKVLLRLILMSYDYGVFAAEEDMLDQFDIWNDNRNQTKARKLVKVYNDLTMDLPTIAM